MKSGGRHACAVTAFFDIILDHFYDIVENS